MAGYIVTALVADQSEPGARCAIAVSVMDSNGYGVQNLNESNFAVYPITDDNPVVISELRNTSVPGFYRLLLDRTSSGQRGQVLALFVTGRRHVAGRMPEGMDMGNTMVKVSVV